MRIILGPASVLLGKEIAAVLGTEAVPVAFKIFPDGENYVRLEGQVKNEDVAIIQTTSPPQDSRLVQLALMADSARRSGARKITAVVPYLAYARQDKVFLKGEALSAEMVACILRSAGVERLITVNVHHRKVLSHFPFPARSVSAISLLAEYFVKRGNAGAFALSPDEGALPIAQEARKVLGGACGYLKKTRDRYTGEVGMQTKILDVEGKTVVVFDDIISTGGTIVAAVKIVKELGPRKIYVACVHPLLIGEAERIIIEAGVEEIVGTDSVPSTVSRVSLAPLISKELAK